MGASMSGPMRRVFSSIFSREKKPKGAAEGDETAQKVSLHPKPSTIISQPETLNPVPAGSISDLEPEGFIEKLLESSVVSLRI